MNRNIHLHRGLFALLLVVGSLMACTDVESTETPGNSQAFGPTQPAFETPVPTATVTGTPLPTATTQPTPTTKVTALPTATTQPTPTTKVAALPTATTQPTPTTKVTALPTATVAPLATAPAMHFAGWSPDSRWVAYWAASQEDVTKPPPSRYPLGTLHFANPVTGQVCAVPGFVASGQPVGVHWSDDGTAVIASADDVFTGQPCQAEPFAPSDKGTPQEDPHPDPARSPQGDYRAATTLVSSESGVLIFETTLTAQGNTQPLQRVTWQIDERLGDYDLMGEWIGPRQFLIYETLTQGPLILNVDGSVIPVLSDLFGLSEVPSILDEQGYSLRAFAAPGMEPDTYHLLLTGVGLEAQFPSARLYHAESGLVETLPYRALWWRGFSEDRQWLLLDEQPDIGGYQSQAIWIRRVDNIDGDWQLLAYDLNSALWTEDGQEMAFDRDASVTWQTFPAAALIGRWDTGQFWTHPVAWSPDGRFLAALGNIPGEWQAGLFVLERPSDLPPTPTGGDGVDPTLAGLVYRTLNGLWRVDNDGRPQLQLSNPEAHLAPDGRRALLADGAGIQIVDLATGEARNLLTGDDLLICCPQWADDDRIIFGSWPQGVDTGPSTGRLTAAAADGSWVQVLEQNSPSNGLPAASPDGRTIAYDQGDSAWLYYWDSGPEWLDVAGYGLPPTKSFKVGSPAWSPDGRHIAWVVGGGFGSGDGFAIGLAILDLEARTVQLRHPYEPIGAGGWPPGPVWSPDGHWLALVTWELNVKSRQAGNLWVLSVDGSVEDQLLLAGVGDLSGRPVWSPDGRWLLFPQHLGGKETLNWRAEAGVWQLERLELPADATVLGWRP